MTMAVRTHFDFRRPFTTRETYLWTLAVTLLALDVATSWYVIAEVGLRSEAHPFTAYLVARFGLPMLAVQKVVIIGAGLTLRALAKAHHGWAVPLGIIAPMAVVVPMNTTAVIAVAL